MAETLTLLDKRLLSLAATGASPEEIGKDTGLEPEVAYQRVSALLAQRTAWSDLQQRQLLLHSAYDVKLRLERWIENSPGFDKDQITAYLRNLQLLSDLLERHMKATEGQMAQVVDSHKVYLVGLVEKITGAVVNELHTAHPDIEMEEIDGVFQQVLSEERLKIAG